MHSTAARVRPENCSPVEEVKRVPERFGQVEPRKVGGSETALVGDVVDTVGDLRDVSMRSERCLG